MKFFIATLVMTIGLIAQPVLAKDFNTGDVAGKIKGILGAGVDISEITSALQQLETAKDAFTEQQAADVRKKLQEQSIKADEAEAYFNDLLKKIKATQAFGDPNGAFVKLMNDARSKALTRAENAKKRNTKVSLKLADSFSASAVAFLDIRDRAIKARNDAIPALTFIEQNKADYIDAIAARAFSIMAEIANDAVNKVEEQSRQVVKAADDLQATLGGTTN